MKVGETEQFARRVPDRLDEPRRRDPRANKLRTQEVRIQTQ
jgi:hypothetical protein